MIPTALTIAGSDSGGGAGAQADLKTFAAHGVHGTSVITALTAQNTQDVLEVWPSDHRAVALQFEAVAGDFKVAAAKTGMLANAAIIGALAEALDRWPISNLVLDPVLASSSGRPLLDATGIEALRRALLPRAALATPNLPEAELLAGGEIRGERGARDAARAIAALGARAVLIKGGHGEDPARCNDLLFDGESFEIHEGPRLDVGEVHGTGCVLSAAIVARLARGEDLREAIGGAKRFTRQCIRRSVRLGGGSRLMRPEAIEIETLDRPEAE